METFADKLAVVTGAGTGMGRELARQLAAQGCDVAMCDVQEDTMQETQELAEADAALGVRITTHICDVADETQVLAFRDAVERDHGRGYVNLLFNNAGIGAAPSMTSEEGREEWERVFNTSWYGVYYNVRAFMPLLMAADVAHITNTSSVNGFWATHGPGSSSSAYSAAKFAVRGFTEALITDFDLFAPHIGVSVVMPGHVGTSISRNSARLLRNREPGDRTASELAIVRQRMAFNGSDPSDLTDDELREFKRLDEESNWERARTTAAEAAMIILEGVRANRWRILVGDDAHALDELVREYPEEVYTPAFRARLDATGHWGPLDEPR